MSENNNNQQNQTEESIADIGIPEISLELSTSEMTTRPTDKTLTADGEPADAKATGDRISAAEETIADLGADVSGILEDIDTFVTKDMIDATLSTEGGVADAKATGDAIAAAAVSAAANAKTAVISTLYPVGSVYVTTLTSVPQGITGTWQEITVNATWADLKNGTRGYGLLPTGTQPGTLHFFLRTA